MQNRFIKWVPLALGFSLAIGIAIGRLINPAHSSASRTYSSIDEVMSYIQSKYVDKVDRDKLTKAAIEGMLKELDPHSVLIPRDELADVKEKMEGNFVGVGIRFVVLHDTLMVLEVIKDGPAEAAGVLKGDRIIAVDGKTIAGAKTKEEDIMKHLRGESGSGVSITVKRGPEEKKLDLKRAPIPINSVDIAYMIDPQTGYIRINRFSESTYDEFMKSVRELTEKSKMKNLILDLRDNSGGYLTPAVKIAGEFFSDARLMVYTDGGKVGRKDYKSSGRPYFPMDKITVLIDENSASASEILAGAIQDNDRGVIVGRRSYGKGLVQEQYSLSDSSALRLTVSRYYTPSGRCIQKPYTKSDEYQYEVEHRILSGELLSRDSIHITDSTRYLTTGGRVVYGGGGIIPDVFIPMDKIWANKSFITLSSHISTFAYEYWDHNRKSLEATYADEASFISRFSPGADIMKSYLAWAQGELKTTFKAEDVSAFWPQLSLRLKAYLARQLYGADSFYKVFNSDDDFIRNALRAINDDAFRQSAMRR